MYRPGQRWASLLDDSSMTFSAEEIQLLGDAIATSRMQEVRSTLIQLWHVSLN